MGLGFFASIIVGGLAGWIGSRIMDAKTGIFVNILLGIIGALVANVILGLLGIYAAAAAAGRGHAGRDHPDRRRPRDPALERR